MEKSWFKEDVQEAGRVICQSAIEGCGIVITTVFHGLVVAGVIALHHVIKLDDLVVVAGQPVLLWLVYIVLTFSYVRTLIHLTWKRKH